MKHKKSGSGGASSSPPKGTVNTVKICSFLSQTFHYLITYFSTMCLTFPKVFLLFVSYMVRVSTSSFEVHTFGEPLKAQKERSYFLSVFKLSKRLRCKGISRQGNILKQA